MTDHRRLEDYPDPLTLDEVAQLERTSRETIRRLAAAGKIPGAYRLGRDWRFSHIGLVEYRRLMSPNPTPLPH